MWVLSICRRAFLGFSMALLLVAGFCYCDDEMVIDVVGKVECADCMGNNIKSRDILLGLQVSIKCKVAGRDQFKTRGVGKLDEEGKFKVILPKEMVKDNHREQLMEDCFAKLIPDARSDVHACLMATESGEDAASKIILIKSKGENNIKHYTFSPTGKLAFSALPCSLKDSKFLPFPKFHLPLHKTLPKFHIPKVLPKKPSLPIIQKKPFLQPIHKKPFPIPSFSKKPFLPPIPEENQKFLIIPKIPHILKKKFIHHHLPKFLPPKHLPHP